MTERTDWNTRFKRMRRGFDVGIVILTLALLFVAVDLKSDLQDSETRAAAWQALGAFVALIPVVMTIWVAMVGNFRAERAEEEASELRAASIAQSEAMIRMADASERQAQLFHAEREQAQKLQLMIADVPKHGTVVDHSGGRMRKRASYHLANFSSFPVLVESVQLHSAKGGSVDVTLALDSESIRGMGAMLNAGELRHLDIIGARQTLSLVGQSSLEFSLTVRCLSPGRGRQSVGFALRFNSWEQDATLEVMESGSVI